MSQRATPRSSPRPRFQIGGELLRLRKLQKYSRSIIARRCKMHVGSLSNIEAGLCLPGAKLVLTLAKIYSTEPEPLIAILIADSLVATKHRLETQYGDLLRKGRRQKPPPPPPTAPEAQSAFKFVANVRPST